MPTTPRSENVATPEVTAASKVSARSLSSSGDALVSMSVPVPATGTSVMRTSCAPVTALPSASRRVICGCVVNGAPARLPAARRVSSSCATGPLATSTLCVASISPGALNRSTTVPVVPASVSAGKTARPALAVGASSPLMRTPGVTVLTLMRSALEVTTFPCASRTSTSGATANAWPDRAS